MTYFEKVETRSPRNSDFKPNMNNFWSVVFRRFLKKWPKITQHYYNSMKNMGSNLI